MLLLRVFHIFSMFFWFFVCFISSFSLLSVCFLVFGNVACTLEASQPIFHRIKQSIIRYCGTINKLMKRWQWKIDANVEADKGTFNCGFAGFAFCFSSCNIQALVTCVYSCAFHVWSIQCVYFVLFAMSNFSVYCGFHVSSCLPGLLSQEMPRVVIWSRSSRILAVPEKKFSSHRPGSTKLLAHLLSEVST